MPRSQRRIERTPDGKFLLRLPVEEREVLRTLPGQLRELLGSDDPALRRLFPEAHPDDPEREAEYRRLVAEELVAGRRRALEVMEATIDADRLDEDQMASWLRSLNDLRLLLGTRLEITEDWYERELDRDDPRAAAFGLYSYLGWLEEQVVEALAESVVDPDR